MLFCEHYKNIPFESKVHAISSFLDYSVTYRVYKCGEGVLKGSALRHPLGAARVTGLRNWSLIKYLGLCNLQSVHIRKIRHGGKGSI